MFGLSRWSPFEELFNFQREVDRVFNQFWSDLPARTSAGQPGSFQVHTSPDAWRIDVPLPGIDPEHINVEVAGSTMTIRAEVSGEGEDRQVTRYERSLTLPQFLDVEKLTAANRHGMLQLTLPLKESVKPRRIQIQSETSDRKQLAAV